MYTKYKYYAKICSAASNMWAQVIFDAILSFKLDFMKSNYDGDLISDYKKNLSMLIFHKFMESDDLWISASDTMILDAAFILGIDVRMMSCAGETADYAVCGRWKKMNIYKALTEDGSKYHYGVIMFDDNSKIIDKVIVMDDE